MLVVYQTLQEMVIINCIVKTEPSSPPHHQDRAVIDEALFEKIAENDVDAFEELYRLTKNNLYAFTLSILRNNDDALDAMQDTYLKIRAAAHLYKPMGKPMAWVYTIARNISMSKLRAKSQTDGVQIEDIENDLSFSYVINTEDKMVLQATLKILNEQEREIILLHAISGLTHSAIAEDLGLPLSTVLSKYHRGLKKLKKYLIERKAQQ